MFNLAGAAMARTNRKWVIHPWDCFQMSTTTGWSLPAALSLQLLRGHLLFAVMRPKPFAVATRFVSPLSSRAKWWFWEIKQQLKK